MLNLYHSNLQENFANQIRSSISNPTQLNLINICNTPPSQIDTLIKVNKFHAVILDDEIFLSKNFHTLMDARVTVHITMIPILMMNEADLCKQSSTLAGIKSLNGSDLNNVVTALNSFLLRQQPSNSHATQNQPHKINTKKRKLSSSDPQLPELIDQLSRLSFTKIEAIVSLIQSINPQNLGSVEVDLVVQWLLKCERGFNFNDKAKREKGIAIIQALMNRGARISDKQVEQLWQMMCDRLSEKTSLSNLMEIDLILGERSIKFAPNEKKQQLLLKALSRIPFASLERYTQFIERLDPVDLSGVEVDLVVQWLLKCERGFNFNDKAKREKGIAIIQALMNRGARISDKQVEQLWQMMCDHLSEKTSLSNLMEIDLILDERSIKFAPNEKKQKFLLKALSRIPFASLESYTQFIERLDPVDLSGVEVDLVVNWLVKYDRGFPYHDEKKREKGVKLINILEGRGASISEISCKKILEVPILKQCFPKIISRLPRNSSQNSTSRIEKVQESKSKQSTESITFLWCTNDQLDTAEKFIEKLKEIGYSVVSLNENLMKKGITKQPGWGESQLNFTKNILSKSNYFVALISNGMVQTKTDEYHLELIKSVNKPYMEINIDENSSVDEITSVFQENQSK